jgi:HEAT repeat protein
MSRWVLASVLFAAGLALWPRPAAAQTGEEDRVKKLIVKLLEDKEVKQRRLALFELEIVGPRVPGVLQAVTIALEKDADPVVRSDAALTLGRMMEDAKDSVPALARALRADKDERVRESAARALLQMMPHAKKALPQLAEALQDSSAPTRAAAAEAIKELGEQAKSIAPKLVAYLKAGTNKKEDSGARLYIAIALGRTGQESDKAVPLFAAMLIDPAEALSVREAAAEGLGRYGLDAQSSAKQLADILGQTKNELSLRLAAVNALAKVEGATSIVWPAFKMGLGDSDSTLRLQSIRAAGPYGKDEPEVVKLLSKSARTDNNVEVRLAAIQELGRLGANAKTAEGDLQYILENDERDVVRQNAEAALKKIREK